MRWSLLKNQEPGGGSNGLSEWEAWRHGANEKGLKYPIEMGWEARGKVSLWMYTGLRSTRGGDPEPRRPRQPQSHQPIFSLKADPSKMDVFLEDMRFLGQNTKKDTSLSRREGRHLLLPPMPETELVPITDIQMSVSLLFLRIQRVRFTGPC